MVTVSVCVGHTARSAWAPGPEMGHRTGSPLCVLGFRGLVAFALLPYSQQQTLTYAMASTMTAAPAGPGVGTEGDLRAKVLHLEQSLALERKRNEELQQQLVNVVSSRDACPIALGFMSACVLTSTQASVQTSTARHADASAGDGETERLRWCIVPEEGACVPRGVGANPQMTAGSAAARRLSMAAHLMHSEHVISDARP